MAELPDCKAESWVFVGGGGGYGQDVGCSGLRPWKMLAVHKGLLAGTRAAI